MDELLLVEDDVRFQRAVAMLLAPRFETRATARARVALDWLAEGIRVAAAIVDLGLPDADGVDLVRAIRALRSDLPVIVVTVSDTSERVLAALDAGATGYVLKEHIAHELGAAIDAALAGDVALSPRAARYVVQARRASSPSFADSPPPLLTTMERRVLDELARGLSYAQIGLVLDISINTVRSRIRTLFDKLGAGSSTEAISIALKRGLLRTDAG
jgi:DNA-binding NarL/FixJ family response regulator